MMIRIPEVLTTAQVQQLRNDLQRLSFVDGSLTAGVYARAVKRNEQADQNPQIKPLQDAMGSLLLRHPLFEMAARPVNMKPILFSRYKEGMEYGTHVDNAVMSGWPPVRSDLSFTLFLSDPDSYDGGELVVEGEPETRVKLPAGHLFLYPSSSLHHVEPVRRGERLAAVSWVQSAVRDPARRQILFDLETLRRRIYEADGKTGNFDLLSRSFANLYRMWADI
ncbi:Fe2+-dependent dioxygenase [Roseomonas sp. SSH11]|uniref:Fe2+-dependent dioxygenase n=1 Tax=Pararoseomonas baculiformis TaxID=2820812 RepID=A0ABS4A8J8_9PROT|nr:Fe2+-dependent dioxygenase [Pararoseomonas baculiformis]MBP0443322.1 Fe2+-dependent dioxygenase [Pararoseomonas baculiformis]